MPWSVRPGVPTAEVGLGNDDVDVRAVALAELVVLGVEEPAEDVEHRLPALLRRGELPVVAIREADGRWR